MSSNEPSLPRWPIQDSRRINVVQALATTFGRFCNNVASSSLGENILAFELRTFQGSSNEGQYFQTVNAAISFVCTRIILPNIRNEISQRHSGQANASPAIQQQAISLAYAHVIGQLLMQAATELIPRSLTAPLNAVRGNATQQQGQVRRQLDYWQSVQQIRGAEDPEQRNSRTEGNEAQASSRAPNSLQSMPSPPVGVSTQAHVPEKLGSSRENVEQVKAIHSRPQPAEAKGGQNRSKLPATSRAILKKSKGKVKRLQNSGKMIPKKSGSRANASEIPEENESGSSTLLPNQISRASSSPRKKGVHRLPEPLHRSSLQAKITEASTRAVEPSIDRAKMDRAISAHHDAHENALRCQGQNGSRETTDLSSALPRVVPVAMRATKNQVENDFRARTTASAVVPETKNQSENRRGTRAGWNSKNAYYAQEQTAFFATIPPTCPSILATARVRRHGGPSSFQTAGGVPIVPNAGSSPAPAISPGLKSTCTPTSIQQMVNSTKEVPRQSIVPRNEAVVNSPSGNLGKSREIFSRIDPSYIGQLASAPAKLDLEENEILKGKGQDGRALEEQSLEQDGAATAESADAADETTGDSFDKGWDEENTAAILAEWTYAEDNLPQEWQPLTSDGGLFEGTDEEVTQRLNEIFFINPTN